MRKMFSKNQIKEIVNQGIESGEISIDTPPQEFPMTVEDEYSLTINADESTLAIGENGDQLPILLSLVGKFLYAYANDILIAKALIVSCDSNSNLAFTNLDATIDGSVEEYKIFDK